MKEITTRKKQGKSDRKSTRVIINNGVQSLKVVSVAKKASKVRFN